jgi:hypothetical protein
VQIKSAKDLTVYQKAYALAMEIFEVSKGFPGEAWAKRRYEAHFVSKLTDADGENGETETWLDFACDCEYLSKSDHVMLTEKCLSRSNAWEHDQCADIFYFEII